MDRLRYILKQVKMYKLQMLRKSCWEVSRRNEFSYVWLCRILGSSAVSTAAQKAPFLRPQGLVEAGIGARMAQKLLESACKHANKNPRKSCLDKDFMTLLLTKAKNRKKRKVSRHCSNLFNRGRFNITWI